MAVAAALALLLSGCVPAAATVPALERKATADDVLPVGIVGTSEFDPETARYIATYHGVDIYLAKQTSEKFDVLCLIMYADASGVSGSVCGGGDHFGLTLGRVGVSADFVRHGVTPRDIEPGWTQLSDNVVVQG